MVISCDGEILDADDVSFVPVVLGHPVGSVAELADAVDWVCLGSDVVVEPVSPESVVAITAAEVVLETLAATT
jgi:hypothetical protein